MFGGSAVELTTQALFELAHATPLCQSPKSGEGGSGGARGLSEEERVRVYESLTKLDFSIAAPARGPPPYMQPIQYFDVPSNRWHSLECHVIGYKDNPNDQDLAEHSSYGIYPSLDRAGMAACVASDGEVYLFGGLQTTFVPDPTIAAPLGDEDLQAKAAAVKAGAGRQSSAVLRLEELGRPPTAPGMSRRLRAMLKAEAFVSSLGAEEKAAEAARKAAENKVVEVVHAWEKSDEVMIR